MSANSASPVKTFSWILWPYSQPLPALRDEFLVGAFRLVLAGDGLRLQLEGSPAMTREQEACQLAESYAGALGRGLGLMLRPLTENEFGSLPAYAFDDGSTQFLLARQAPRNPRLALKAARNALLGGGNQALRRCYDYIQDAEDSPRESLFYLYKAIEAIENDLGDEKKAITILNVGSALKGIKRLANESDRDERHAPRDSEAVRQLTASERDAALGDTKTILRAYENYLRMSGKV